MESVDYDSFGSGASSLTRYGYTGREWDGEANLYYYRNRWYDPQTGRFISEDPIGFEGGVNWYSYVGNNPTGFVDPSGLNPWAAALELGKVGAAIGGVPGALIGGSLGIVLGYIIWNADCDALTAGVDRLIAPYITSTTSDQTGAKPRSIPLAPPFPRDRKDEFGFYRGGTDLIPRPNEIRIRDGLVQDTHGISVFTNPAKIPVKFDVYKVLSVPESLQIKQRGRDPEHYEIMPRAPMPYEDYVRDLTRVILVPHPR